MVLHRPDVQIRVFDELVSDSDPNLTNVLIGEDWKIWRIDSAAHFASTRTERRYQGVGTLQPAIAGETEGAGRERGNRKTTTILTKER